MSRLLLGGASSSDTTASQHTQQLAFGFLRRPANATAAASLGSNGTKNWFQSASGQVCIESRGVIEPLHSLAMEIKDIRSISVVVIDLLDRVDAVASCGNERGCLKSSAHCAWRSHDWAPLPEDNWTPTTVHPPPSPWHRHPQVVHRELKSPTDQVRWHTGAGRSTRS